MSPVLLAALTLAAATSSKLGVVVAGDVGASTSPAGRLLAACPALVVFPLASGAANAEVGAQLRAYRSACPGGKVVVQVGGRGLGVNQAVATTEWNRSWFTAVQSVITFSGTSVDGVEGPWEPTGTSAELAAFWAQFAFHVSSVGWLPIVGAFPPGLPVGSGTQADAFCGILDAVRLGVSRFGVSFHVQVPTILGDFAAPATSATDPAFAFARVATDCALGATPVFLTQAAPAGTWSPADADWLIWFSRQLGSATSVVGVAAFAVGTTGALDLSTIAAQLEAELSGAGGGGGGGGPAPSTGGTVGPSYGAATGELGSGQKQGCATGGAEVGLAALAPLAAWLRRRARRGSGAAGRGGRLRA